MVQCVRLRISHIEQEFGFQDPASHWLTFCFGSFRPEELIWPRRQLRSFRDGWRKTHPTSRPERAWDSVRS